MEAFAAPCLSVPSKQRTRIVETSRTSGSAIPRPRHGPGSARTLRSHGTRAIGPGTGPEVDDTATARGDLALGPGELAQQGERPDLLLATAGVGGNEVGGSCGRKPL